jgi:hypothetical protein
MMIYTDLELEDVRCWSGKRFSLTRRVAAPI